MKWNRSGEEDIYFDNDDVPEDLKGMMGCKAPFTTCMICRGSVLKVNAVRMKGVRRKDENFDRFQMYLLHDHGVEIHSHWYSNEELEELNSHNLNHKLQAGLVQSWMQCDNSAPVAGAPAAGAPAAGAQAPVAQAAVAQAPAALAPQAAPAPGLAIHQLAMVAAFNAAEPDAMVMGAFHAVEPDAMLKAAAQMAALIAFAPANAAGGP